MESIQVTVIMPSEHPLNWQKTEVLIWEFKPMSRCKSLICHDFALRNWQQMSCQDHSSMFWCKGRSTEFQVYGESTRCRFRWDFCESCMMIWCCCPLHLSPLSSRSYRNHVSVEKKQVQPGETKTVYDIRQPDAIQLTLMYIVPIPGWWERWQYYMIDK